MAKILVIADIYFESQYFVDSIPTSNEFKFSTQVNNSIGSKMLNAARVLSKLGNSTSIYGKVGNDQFGEFAKKVISKEYNLEDKYVSTLVSDKEKTGQISVITNTQGDSSVTLYPGVNKLFDLQDVSKISKLISEFDLIYCCSNLPLEALYLLIKETTKYQIKIFIDLPTKLKELDLDQLSSADFISPNRQETESILNIKIETIEDARNAVFKFREKVKDNILITLDKDGCIILEKNSNEPQHLKTDKVEQIDATGSGDIFRAVFVSEYLKTGYIESSVRAALKIATKSISIQGVSNTISNLFNN